ncbi:uncharacterized protein LOC123695196 [Colias croceus]|uniref:uncharacterized protein LOC123695196 n=1 Tax=Colias crocea TaxID=72248 RepID=UPI001E27ACAC|nr:uncharacterized protein LOC123695196 [Colias croceus]
MSHADSNSVCVSEYEEADPRKDLNNVLIDEVVRSNINNTMQESVECENVEQNRKRTRTVEGSDDTSEEGWNVVSRSRKAVRRLSGTSEERVDVCVTSTKQLPKQLTLAKLFKNNNIKGVKRVKYTHSYKMIVTFDENIYAQSLIECKTFKDMEWRCYKTSEVGVSYGVIRDIDLEASDEDILSNLKCEREIVAIKRLNKRNFDGTASWIKCEALRLGFKGNSIPSHVFLYGLGIKVDPYIFPVTQCSRCWKYGHSRFQCSSTKVICPKCSRDHENCDTMVFKCVNCSGNHMALQKVCPVFQTERRLRELMSQFNCTFKKALSLYVPPSPAPGNNANPEPHQIDLDEFPCLGPGWGPKMKRIHIIKRKRRIGRES